MSTEKEDFTGQNKVFYKISLPQNVQNMFYELCKSEQNLWCALLQRSLAGADKASTSCPVYILMLKFKLVLPIKYVVNLFSNVCTKSQEFTINSM
jgi:hypothetical protein